VSSFKEVCSEAAEQMGVPELNVSELVQEPAALADAVAVSKESVIEWMELQEALVGAGAGAGQAGQAAQAEPEFVFRVKGAQASGKP
jgi:plasmid maintenance system antidote protein VapI